MARTPSLLSLPQLSCMSQSQPDSLSLFLSLSLSLSLSSQRVDEEGASVSPACRRRG